MYSYISHLIRCSNENQHESNKSKQLTVSGRSPTCSKTIIFNSSSPLHCCVG